MSRFAVDWDGTCVTDAWPKMGTWIPGAVEALVELLALGDVVIYSCRVAPFETDEKTYRDPNIEIWKIRSMLDAKSLQAVTIWTKPYKPPAMAYIDNRAIRFNGDWEEVIAQVDAL